MPNKQKVLVVGSGVGSSILGELKKFAEEKGIELLEVHAGEVPSEMTQDVSEYLKMIDEAHKKAGNSKIMFRSGNTQVIALLAESLSFEIQEGLLEEISKMSIIRPSQKNKKIGKVSTNKKGSKTYRQDNRGRKFDYHGQRSRNLRQHTPTHRGR